MRNQFKKTVIFTFMFSLFFSLICFGLKLRYKFSSGKKYDYLFCSIFLDSENTLIANDRGLLTISFAALKGDFGRMKIQCSPIILPGQGKTFSPLLLNKDFHLIRGFQNESNLVSFLNMLENNFSFPPLPECEVKPGFQWFVNFEVPPEEAFRIKSPVKVKFSIKEIAINPTILVKIEGETSFKISDIEQFYKAEIQFSPEFGVPLNIQILQWSPNSPLGTKNIYSRSLFSISAN